MKIAVLGMGTVGETIATKLIENDHEVMVGSRTNSNEKSITWAKGKERASYGTFAQAASFAEEFIFNCVLGEATLTALELAGSENMEGKIIIDLANPLDFSDGFPPTMFISNMDSLGEQVQFNFPDSYVVKSLNTINCTIMLDPSMVSGDHNVFMSGNSEEAKSKFASLLKSYGWETDNIIDLGDISTSRGTEMMLPMWTRLYGKFGHANFNFHIQR